jgi:hypothetical protein
MDGRSGEQPGATSESGPPCVKLSSLLVHTFRDCDFSRNRGTLFCAPHSSPTAVVTHTMCIQRWRRHTLFKNDAFRVDDVRARRLGSDVQNLHRVATTHATASHEEPPRWLHERPLRWGTQLASWPDSWWHSSQGDIELPNVAEQSTVYKNLWFAFNASQVARKLLLGFLQVAC